MRFVATATNTRRASPPPPVCCRSRTSAALSRGQSPASPRSPRRSRSAARSSRPTSRPDTCRAGTPVGPFDSTTLKMRLGQLERQPAVGDDLVFVLRNVGLVHHQQVGKPSRSPVTASRSMPLTPPIHGASPRPRMRGGALRRSSRSRCSRSDGFVRRSDSTARRSANARRCRRRSESNALVVSCARDDLSAPRPP